MNLVWYTPEGAIVGAETPRRGGRRRQLPEARTWSPAELPSAAGHFLEVTFAHPSGTSRATVFLTEPKRINLSDPNLTVGVEEVAGALSVVVRAKRPAFWVTIDQGDLPAGLTTMASRSSR